jgi:predicted enzyme related to lactoylglutathione lyase
MMGRMKLVRLVAGNFDRQCEFLQSGRGLTLRFRDGDEWAQLDSAGVSVALAGPRDSFGLPPDTWVPVLEVDDLDGAAAAIDAAGGTCGGIRDMGSHGRTCLARDPRNAPLALFAAAAG